MNVKVTLDQPTPKAKTVRNTLTCRPTNLRKNLALVELSPLDAGCLAEGDTVTLVTEFRDNDAVVSEVRTLPSCWRIVMIETRQDGPFAYCTPVNPSLGRPMLLI